MGNDGDIRQWWEWLGEWLGEALGLCLQVISQDQSLNNRITAGASRFKYDNICDSSLIMSVAVCLVGRWLAFMQ